jgi:hypothetical protein
MIEKLDFSLPQPKAKRSGTNVFIIFLLIAVLAVGIINLRNASFSSTGGNKAIATEGLSAKQIEELAGKLESRNLYESAANVWQEYLAATTMSEEGKARMLFRIGDLLLKADQPEKAIPFFYRSEMVQKVADLEAAINEKLKESFEKAGQFAGLRYEMKERTGYQNDSDAADVVVAEIGQEKITAAGLDAMLERQIDAQLSQYAAMLDPEQLKEQKKAMLAQMNTPQNKMQILQSIIAEEALYREALEREMDTKPQVKQLLRDANRRILAQQLMEKELADKVLVSDSDLQTYYQANKSNYMTEQKEENSEPPQPKPFEEVEQEIRTTLTSQKRQEAQQRLIEPLLDKYNIIIHRDVIMKETADQPEEKKIKKQN